jgi:hypothetical protein
VIGRLDCRPDVSGKRAFSNVWRISAIPDSVALRSAHSPHTSITMTWNESSVPPISASMALFTAPNNRIDRAPKRQVSRIPRQCRAHPIGDVCVTDLRLRIGETHGTAPIRALRMTPGSRTAECGWV